MQATHVSLWWTSINNWVFLPPSLCLLLLACSFAHFLCLCYLCILQRWWTASCLSRGITQFGSFILLIIGHLFNSEWHWWKMKQMKTKTKKRVRWVRWKWGQRGPNWFTKMNAHHDLWCMGRNEGELYAKWKSNSSATTGNSIIYKQQQYYTEYQPHHYNRI